MKQSYTLLKIRFATYLIFFLKLVLCEKKFLLNFDDYKTCCTPCPNENPIPQQHKTETLFNNQQSDENFRTRLLYVLYNV